jgi:hypothetical protein
MNHQQAGGGVVGVDVGVGFGFLVRVEVGFPGGDEVCVTGGVEVGVTVEVCVTGGVEVPGTVEDGTWLCELVVTDWLDDVVVVTEDAVDEVACADELLATTAVADFLLVLEEARLLWVLEGTWSELPCPEPDPTAGTFCEAAVVSA